MNYPCPLPGHSRYTFASRDAVQDLQSGVAIPLEKVHFISIGKVDDQHYPWLEGFVTDAFLRKHEYVLSGSFLSGTEEGIPAADAASNDMVAVCAECLKAALESSGNREEEALKRLLDHLG